MPSFANKARVFSLPKICSMALAFGSALTRAISLPPATKTTEVPAPARRTMLGVGRCSTARAAVSPSGAWIRNVFVPCSTCAEKAAPFSAGVMANFAPTMT